jgi:hypothetical protein
VIPWKGRLHMQTYNPGKLTKYGQVKKPICISQYNMFMKGVDRANQYLAYYSLPRKTLKWMKKVALWLINCALFNSFSVHKILNPGTNLRLKEFMMQVAKAWSTDQMAVADPESDRLSVTGPINCHPT